MLITIRSDKLYLRSIDDSAQLVATIRAHGTYAQVTLQCRTSAESIECWSRNLSLAASSFRRALPVDLAIPAEWAESVRVAWATVTLADIVPEF